MIIDITTLEKRNQELYKILKEAEERNENLKKIIDATSKNGIEEFTRFELGD